MTKHSRHRGGFTLIMAIVLIGLVGMTVGAPGVLFANQTHRTERLAEDAQLRQLLLAGAEFARAHLTNASSLNDLMPLPDSLVEESASVTMHEQPSPAAEKRIVAIEASLPRRKLSQTVEFSLRDGAWQLTAADLGG